MRRGVLAPCPISFLNEKETRVRENAGESWQGVADERTVRERASDAGRLHHKSCFHKGTDKAVESLSVTRYTDGNGQVRQYQYDASSTVSSADSGDALLNRAGAGVTVETKAVARSSIDGTASYSYDPTGQLVGATYSSPNPEIPESQNPESYSYDANGNRVTANGDVYATGADNRLLNDGTYTYAYDAEGNRTARFIDADDSGNLTTGDTEITEYTWDARNRLVEVATMRPIRP